MFAPRPRAPLVVLSLFLALACVLAPLAAAAAGEERYVALGDSYSSGLGTRTADGPCRRGTA